MGISETRNKRWQGDFEVYRATSLRGKFAAGEESLLKPLWIHESIVMHWFFVGQENSGICKYGVGSVLLISVRSYDSSRKLRKRPSRGTRNGVRVSRVIMAESCVDMVCQRTCSCSFYRQTNREETRNWGICRSAGEDSSQMYQLCARYRSPHMVWAAPL